MKDIRSAVAATGLVKEAEAMLKVAEILEGRSKEEACSIMAAICAVLGFYDDAHRFVALAKCWREVVEREAENYNPEPYGATP